MKISANEVRFGNSYKAHTKPKEKQEALSGRASHFDTVILNKDRDKTEEGRMAAQLSRQLSAQIRLPVSPAHVEALEKQVKEGSYKIDLYHLARKIAGV
ncbi:MAG: flagellar biosynthesis anti-sigma factor FlgM [Clostridiales bacterium]|nr:flagellar biosynthesis anti-sigma factor FlgM [Clostridiales bacterium]